MRQNDDVPARPLSSAVQRVAARLLAQGPAPALERSPSTLESIAARAILVRATGQNAPSPCVSVCRMSADTSLCEGCWRTLDEIIQWSTADEPAKRAIWAQIEQRLAIGTD